MRTLRHILCSVELKAGGPQKKMPTLVAGWAEAIELKTRSQFGRPYWRQM